MPCYGHSLAAQPSPAQTYGLPVRAQPLLPVQHVVDAPAIAFQQLFASLLAASGALAGGEGEVLPATFLTLQDPAHAEGTGRQGEHSPSPMS